MVAIFIFYLTINTMMEVRKEANDSQNEVLRTVFPFTVDWRTFMLLGCINHIILLQIINRRRVKVLGRT